MAKLSAALSEPQSARGHKVEWIQDVMQVKYNLG